MESQLISGAANNSQDVEEDVDDIQVKVQCGKYVLFRRNGIFVFATQHQLRIEDQINREEQSAQGSVD